MQNYDKEIEEYLKKYIPIVKEKLDSNKDENKSYYEQIKKLEEIENILDSEKPGESNKKKL